MKRQPKVRRNLLYQSSRIIPKPYYPKAVLSQSRIIPKPYYPKTVLSQSRIIPKPYYPKAVLSQSQCLSRSIQRILEFRDIFLTLMMTIPLSQFRFQRLTVLKRVGCFCYAKNINTLLSKKNYIIYF